MCPTSAAQTQPIARQAGTAALEAVPPPASATTSAASAVTTQAASSRSVTLTEGRAVRSGDMGASRKRVPASTIAKLIKLPVAQSPCYPPPRQSLVRGEDANDGPPAAVRYGNRADAGALGAGHTTP